VDQHIIFVPTQVLADSNMIMHHGRFHDNISFIRTLVKELRGRKDIFLLAKRHPKEPDPQEELHGILKGCGVWIEDINTLSAIEASSAVMTLNSTVGLEAAILGKPVVVFAPALYSHKGFTYEVENDADLNSLVEILLDNWKFREAQQKALVTFLAYMLQYYLIPANGKQTESIYNRFLAECFTYDNKTGTTNYLHQYILNCESDYQIRLKNSSNLTGIDFNVKRVIKSLVKRVFKV